MDSLDLIAAFLNENGVEAEKFRSEYVRTKGHNIIPKESARVFVYTDHRHPEMRNKIMIRCGITFDLHNPNSLPDILAHIKGRNRTTIKWPRRTTHWWDNG